MYSHYYREAFSAADIGTAGSWDVFLSAYNDNERVRTVFASVTAARKVWLIHSEYGYPVGQGAQGPEVYDAPTLTAEDLYMRGLLAFLRLQGTERVCVDISGLLRPHIVFMVKLFASIGIKQFDVLYSEPQQYVLGESTQFSAGSGSQVRPVAGFDGHHSPSLSDGKDVLIIAVGYEHELLQQVANVKANSRKRLLVGFPPLQADFYQENILRASRARESLAPDDLMRPLYAPACDPFITAEVISAEVSHERAAGAQNFYLCPLSSKPQALGMALYYLKEGEGKHVSIIYPFASRYERSTSVGLSRVWHYAIELP